MEGILEGGTPRRGSLTSLHRQSSGSFSHSSRLTTTPAITTTTSNSSLNLLYKDLDKFTRYFIIKSIQVIVQSRLACGKKIKTECKPSGNDWFNINISDNSEVSDQTKCVIDTDKLSVRSNWRVCCEISLQTNDGGHLVLEHWIISNKSLLNTSQTHLPTKLIKMRTRLNSIDDCSSDIKLQVGTNSENHDIKSSASCFTLSSTPNQAAYQAATITASPSTTSLSNNVVQGQLPTSTNNSKSQEQGIKASSLSSIYTIYNKMSLLLKTLITTTHIIPAYSLASRASQADSCVICYRVYTSIPSNKTSSGAAKGSIEDINYNSTIDSPNKRSSSSNSSFGSLNIRDFVDLDELDHFCPILKLGSIKSEVNELDVSLCYRTNINNSNHLMKSLQAKDLYNKILDEDCITAAKQLLAGNGKISQNADCNGEKLNLEPMHSNAKNILDQPLRPPFATEQKIDKNCNDPNLILIDSAFEGLVKIKQDNECERIDDIIKVNSNGLKQHAQSEPIQVPSVLTKAKHIELCQNLSSNSTPKSLTDSFVFVDLNPPFASEEQNEITSFFTGPSPAFSNAFEGIKNVDELSNQLADIEADASQIDEFVNNICISEDEEDEKSIG